MPQDVHQLQDLSHDIHQLQYQHIAHLQHLPKYQRLAQLQHLLKHLHVAQLEHLHVAQALAWILLVAAPGRTCYALAWILLVHLVQLQDLHLAQLKHQLQGLPQDHHWTHRLHCSPPQETPA